MQKHRVESAIPFRSAGSAGRYPAFRHPAIALVHVNGRDACSELCSRIRSMGYPIQGIWKASQALRALNRHTFDLILLDARQDEAGAWRVLIRITQNRPDVRVVVLLKARRWSSHVSALTLGATDCFYCSSLSSWFPPLVDTYLPVF